MGEKEMLLRGDGASGSGVATLEERVHVHLLAGPHSTASLSVACGASVPTLARAIARLRVLLRKRGMELVSVRSGGGYRYEIFGSESHVRKAWQGSLLKSLAGSVPERKSGRGPKPEDEAVYGRDW
jgi:hypothetical protein